MRVEIRWIDAYLNFNPPGMPVRPTAGVRFEVKGKSEWIYFRKEEGTLGFMRDIGWKLLGRS